MLPFFSQYLPIAAAVIRLRIARSTLHIVSSRLEPYASAFIDLRTGGIGPQIHGSLASSAPSTPVLGTARASPARVIRRARYFIVGGKNEELRSCGVVELRVGSRDEVASDVKASGSILICKLGRLSCITHIPFDTLIDVRTNRETGVDATALSRSYLGE